MTVDKLSYLDEVDNLSNVLLIVHIPLVQDNTLKIYTFNSSTIKKDCLKVVDKST